ncbi:MAG TPA: phosphotransferase [Anaerolineales bacterium]|nr:phosphotransferase [Anaerolineales bacterium]
MAEGLLEKLQAIDIKLLTDFVQQDQNDPSFEISSWDVNRLSNKGIANPDGLWLFSGLGTGDSENRPWAIVLKILTRQQEELPTDNVWHWKREFSFAQSSLSKHLQRPVRAPRIYHTQETPEGGWVWMEYVTGTSSAPWTADEYAFAAHELGLWNGAYLTGASLPTEPWLTQQHYRSWLAGVDFEQALQFPLTQKHISREILISYEQLWNEREHFFNVLENLPQVFSHFDSQRRNLFIRSGKNGRRELVLLDWGQCGIGAIGAELNWLVGLSAALLEWPPATLVQLDEITFPSYLQGLKESGWSGDANLVRLGFTSMLAVYIGCAFPSLAAWWCVPENSPFALQQFNRVEEELYVAWIPLFNYSLDYADEARALMKKLRFR